MTEERRRRERTNLLEAIDEIRELVVEGEVTGLVFIARFADGSLSATGRGEGFREESGDLDVAGTSQALGEIQFHLARQNSPG